MVCTPPRAARCRGTTLLEVVIALALLSGALVALAGLIVLATNANRQSRVASQGVILATQKMEQLMGLAWGYEPSGEDRVDLVTDVSVWPESVGGRGLEESPEGSLASNVPGFVDYLDENGRWVGTGASPTAESVYVRRWSIRPLPDSPLDTLVLRVVVIPTASASASRGGTGAPGVAQISCVRSRRGT